MNAALIYRPRRRWLFWIALTCAAAIHLGAVVLATSKPDKIVPMGVRPQSGEVEIEYAESDQPPLEESAALRQSPSNEEMFPEENQMPTPVRPHKKTRAASVLSGTRTASSSVKTLVKYAPRPVYPYEARRQRLVGSGIAMLTVDPETGNVTAVRMRQSCGNDLLDHATLEALRRWRFKHGSALTVEVPIMYTLMGASY
jgi:TonB family protein